MFAPRGVQHPAAGLGAGAAKNWPPFFPVLVHDIALQLPVAAQPLATHSHGLMLGALGVAAANVLVSVVPAVPDWPKGIFTALLALPFLAALSVGRHWALYCAARADSSLLYVVYFACALLEVASYGLCAVLDALGALGALARPLALVLLVMRALAFSGVAVLGANLARMAVVHFRAGGHSVQRAGAEAQRGAAAAAVGAAVGPSQV